MSHVITEHWNNFQTITALAIGFFSERTCSIVITLRALPAFGGCVLICQRYLIAQTVYIVNDGFDFSM